MSEIFKAGLKCEICDVEENRNYDLEGSVLCGWCYTRMLDFIRLSKLHEVINIFWGSGKVDLGSMKTIYKLIVDRNIKSIIEYGTGLSTEILYLFVDRIVSFDEFKKHSDLYAKLITLKTVEFHSYDPLNKQLPDLNEKFGMAFVDGGQDRAEEVRHAMKHSDIIFLHDPNAGEQGFFPNPEWKEIAFKIYERIK